MGAYIDRVRLKSPPKNFKQKYIKTSLITVNFFFFFLLSALLRELGSLCWDRRYGAFESTCDAALLGSSRADYFYEAPRRDSNLGPKALSLLEFEIAP